MRPAALFPQPPLVDFRYPHRLCSCGGVLKAKKSQTKQVVSLSGTYIARRFVQQCSCCGSAFEDPALRRWVAHGCNTAWDVLVFVGRRLFEDCRSVVQVCQELADRDVVISESQISKLGRKFIFYLATAHRRATPRIRQSMQRKGGYILHLDAVHQDDAPALMTGIDELSRMVLANVKVPSENAEQIVPFLAKIKSDYGNPIACVHDMGTGICKAVSTVFADSKDFICHFHFLRDAGKDLLEPSYRKLRSCLRRHAVNTRFSELVRHARQALADRADEANAIARSLAEAKTDGDPSLTTLVAAYGLALWCLQAKHSGDGYGFPFDRPLLSMTERILIVLDHLPWLLQSLPGDNAAGNRLFLRLSRKVIDVAGDPDIERCVDELRWRCRLFDQLRSAMRIAVIGGKNGLNDDGEVSDMDSIRRKVGRFRHRLDTEVKLSADPLCDKLAAQIDKYADKLFADPIRVQTPSGSVMVYPQRTNNILEQFFRGLRRDHRRRTGDNRMHRTLQTMLADTPLVKNLSNPEYMKILLDGKSTLEDLFADLDMEMGPDDLVQQDTNDRILPGFKKLTQTPDLPHRFYMFTRATVDGVKSNQIVWQ